jgi:hypothetical protein
MLLEAENVLAVPFEKPQNCASPVRVGSGKLVAWDAVEPPTRGFSVRTSCVTTGLHLSLSPSIQRVMTTLDQATWPIFSIWSFASIHIAAPNSCFLVTRPHRLVRA